MSYTVQLTKKAEKQFKKLAKKQKFKLKEIIDTILKVNPFLGKKLHGDLEGDYSVRLNIKDRILYDINKKDREVYIFAVRSHYGD